MGVGAGLYMCDVVKTVHVRYLISWWVLVITANMQSETGFPSSHQLKSPLSPAWIWQRALSCQRMLAFLLFTTEAPEADGNIYATVIGSWLDDRY